MPHTTSAYELVARLTALATTDPPAARRALDDLVDAINDGTGSRYADHLAPLHMLALAGLALAPVEPGTPPTAGVRMRPFEGGYGSEPVRVADLTAWATGVEPTVASEGGDRAAVTSDGTMPEGDDPEPAAAAGRS